MAAKRLSSGSKASLHVRTITGAVLVLVLLPSTFFGDWFFFALFAIFAVVGIHELLAASGPKKYNFLVKTAVYLFVLSFIYWTFLKNYLRNKDMFPGGVIQLQEMFVSLLGIILYAICLFFIAIVDYKVTLSDVTYLFTVGLIFAVGFQSIYFLRYFGNCSGVMFHTDETIAVSWGSGTTTFGTYFRDYYQALHGHQNWFSSFVIAFLLIGVWMSDVGAYLIGMLFGKHRMNPRVSPHKTWEGFWGGFVVSLLSSLGFAAILEFGFNLPLIPGLLQFSYSPLLDGMGIFHGQAWPLLLLCAILMPTIGNVGGFLFSLIKRNYGIKDYGKFFPGHGGVIDRFDSVMVSAMFLSVVIELSAFGWRFAI